MPLVDRFILWARKTALRRNAGTRQRVVTFGNHFLFSRFEFLWQDEYPDIWWDRHLRWLEKQDPDAIDSFAWTGTPPRRFNRPPIWRPFNIFLHWWRPGPDAESFHDHPRWSITICLRGRIIEKTPWWTRELRPGSVVIRGRKAIHAFEVPPGFNGKVWTLFIVGRRNYRQNTYVITPR